MNTNISNEDSGRKTAGGLTIMSLVLIGLAIAGCSGGKTEKLVIRGSNTIGEELAPQFIKAFRKGHPTIRFDTEFKGTGYGLGALSSGNCDIAAASRTVTTNEMDLLRESAMQLNDYVIGTYSVAVIVKADNPVGNLTPEQVRDIFTGAITNWSEVGGPDAPIRRYIRNPISGTYLGFQELAMGNKPYAHVEKAFINYQQLIHAVSQDANGIGYSTIALANQTGTKAVAIGGVEATAATVNQGNYPYARVLRFYTNKANEAPEARDFIQFAQSPDGQEILAQMGFVPKP